MLNCFVLSQFLVLFCCGFLGFTKVMIIPIGYLFFVPSGYSLLVPIVLTSEAS